MENQMEFPEYFTMILKARRMYKAELGRRIKKTQPYIYHICTGKRPTPKPAMMARIIKAIGDLTQEEAKRLMKFSYQRVFGEHVDEEFDKQMEALPSACTHGIPILTLVSAAQVLDVKNVSELKDIEGSTTTDLKGKRLFALKVKDSSMEPEFFNGDIIVVDPDANWKSGDYVIARLNHDETLIFTQLKIQKDVITLHPLTHIKLTKKDFNKRVAIIGKVVERKTRY